MASIEKKYYSPVKRWLEEKAGCESTDTECKLHGFGFLSADVIGRKDGSVIACEVKPLAYPFGAEGSGAVGQALALRLGAKVAYVVYVGSDLPSGTYTSWQFASTRRDTDAFLRSLDLEIPKTFEDYCVCLRRSFEKLFGGLGLGLLVVHELDSTGAPSAYEVRELIAPDVNWNKKFNLPPAGA